MQKQRKEGAESTAARSTLPAELDNLRPSGSEEFLLASIS